MSLPFCPRGGRRDVPPSADGESPAEVQRKTLRPLGANTLAQFACPAQPVQKKDCRPDRANPPAAVRVPRKIGAEKPAARKGRIANAIRVPRAADAEKRLPPG